MVGGAALEGQGDPALLQQGALAQGRLHLRSVDTDVRGAPPLLELPTTFEVEDPTGYYHTVIFARLEKTAENAYWENAHRAQLRPLAAGGIEAEDPAGAQAGLQAPPGGGAGGKGGPGGGLKAGGGKVKLPKVLFFIAVTSCPFLRFRFPAD